MSAAVPLSSCGAGFSRLADFFDVPFDVPFEGRAEVAAEAFFVAERLVLPVGIRGGYHCAQAMSTGLQTKARRRNFAGWHGIQHVDRTGYPTSSSSTTFVGR